jgi:hypothetical protein
MMKTLVRSTGVLVAAVWACSGLAAQERVLPAVGPEGAASQFEVFLDLSGQTSSHLAVVLDALRHRHPRDVRIVVRQLPPENDPGADLLHRAALAAGRQGRFWEMARVVLANQEHVSREDLLAMAAQLQLDVARFTSDLDDPTWDEALQVDRRRATDLAISTAPAVLHDGQAVTGELTRSRFEALLRPQP